MNNGQTIVLHSDNLRRLAKELIDKAPQDAIVNIKAARRSLEQNSKLWAILSDVSRSKPQGRVCTPNVWKLIFMQALDHEVQFEMGLDGKPFPIGHSTSRLTKDEMSNLIELIFAYGAQNGVKFTGPDEINNSRKG